MECDAAGRLKQFYLADGQIKIRLTNSAGVDQVVADNVLVIGPSSGGGGGGSVDPTTILATGDMKIVYGTGSLAGFVRANGRTIGSATSGATERANADTQALFEYLWNTDPNLAVSGGRGANAAADWAANKTITLPDARNALIAGLGDMGNTDRGLFAGVAFTRGNSTTLGSTLGAGTTTLTPNLIPNITSFGNPNIVVNAPSGRLVSVSASVSGFFASAGSGFFVPQGTGIWEGVTTLSGFNSIGVSSTNTGGPSTTIPNVAPTILMTIYIKL